MAKSREKKREAQEGTQVHPHELERTRTNEQQRALLVAALPDGDDLSELRELLSTAKVEVVGQLVQHRDEPHPNTYVGEGKLSEIKQLAKELEANVVITDDELSPRQERNIEGTLGLPVLDRTAVILDIFATHAGSAESKMQVELAQLQYNMARMRGLWTHLDRLGVGGVGTRGPGETQIETDRRLASQRVSKLRRRLEGVKASRANMRKERSRSPHLPSVALVGYTNAGKSSLLNALTGAEVSAADQLFHTLDPTTRTLVVHGRDYLLTDTVGFIKKLPHKLVEAFSATLEETVLADLLLHVVDASGSDDEIDSNLRAVNEVLDEIGASGADALLVFNKIDLVDQYRREVLAARFPKALQLSAQKPDLDGGLPALTDWISGFFDRQLQQVSLLIPYSKGAALAQLRQVAGDFEPDHQEDGYAISVRIPPQTAGRFKEFIVGVAGE